MERKRRGWESLEEGGDTVKEKSESVQGGVQSQPHVISVRSQSPISLSSSFKYQPTYMMGSDPTGFSGGYILPRPLFPPRSFIYCRKGFNVNCVYFILTCDSVKLPHTHSGFCLLLGP